MGGFDIVAIGEAMVEFSRASAAADCTEYLQGFGGDTSNCLIAAARQGGRCGYITMVGNDEYGDLLIDLWRDNNIDTSAVLRHATAPTGYYHIDYDASGSHVFDYHRKGSAANYLTPQDLPQDIIKQAKILHLSSISQAISEQARTTCGAAMDIARGSGTRVSYNINFRPALWSVEEARRVIFPTLALCDIVLPSLEESHALTDLQDPQAVLDFYRSHTDGIILLTMGKEGVWVDSGNGGRQQVVPPQVEAIDATGAGDTFSGTFLHHYLRCGDILEAVNYANVAAALSTCGKGAVAPIPTIAQVQKFMDTPKT